MAGGSDLCRTRCSRPHLGRIMQDGLSFEGSPIQIPEPDVVAERLLRERGWVLTMQKTMPPDFPRRDDAVELLEKFLEHVGFSIH